MRLHPNAATRVLRAEIERLVDARAELVEAVDDPRIPAGVMLEQIHQCDRETTELEDALMMLEAVAEMDLAPPAQMAVLA